MNVSGNYSPSKKYRVGNQYFRFKCDASEYSFQLGLPYRSDSVRVKPYDDHSYGAWHVEDEYWVAIFEIEKVL